ncbi:MAG: cell division protein ZapE, partial [Tepidiphilus sp.]|nr:cell division protein ZapE [Tepidiphilus sp.]
YLEIAREHDTVLLSGIPRMGPAQASQARRFTWLIDVLYDHRVKLIATAEAEPQELYREGLNAHEFARTASRLIEMRTREYLAEAHRPD